MSIDLFRDVAQLGSAPRLGRGGRTFKSCHPDHLKKTFESFSKVFFVSKIRYSLVVTKYFFYRFFVCIIILVVDLGRRMNLFGKIVVVVILLLGILPVCAEENFEYNSDVYHNMNYKQIKDEADKSFEQFIHSPENYQKEKYLQDAMSKYYTLTMVNGDMILPYVQLGRIYDETDNSKLAKECFCKASNIRAKDPILNFYFGEYYYKRHEYAHAITHYKIANEGGFSNKYELYLRLAITYEKIADISNAKKFYELSYSMKPDYMLQRKIQSLDESDFDANPVSSGE